MNRDERIEKLEQDVLRLQAQVELLTRFSAGQDKLEAKAAFMTMTKKQHAILQLLLAGYDNETIATKFYGTASEAHVNTVKTHVRAIGMRLGVEGRVDRKAICLRAQQTYDLLGADEYERLAGIPKNHVDAIGTKADRKARPSLYEMGRKT